MFRSGGINHTITAIWRSGSIYCGLYGFGSWQAVTGCNRGTERERQRRTDRERPDCNLIARTYPHTIFWKKILGAVYFFTPKTPAHSSAQYFQSYANFVSSLALANVYPAFSAQRNRSCRSWIRRRHSAWCGVSAVRLSLLISMSPVLLGIYLANC